MEPAEAALLALHDLAVVRTRALTAAEDIYAQLAQEGLVRRERRVITSGNLQLVFHDNRLTAQGKLVAAAVARVARGHYTEAG